ncbi:MAG: thioredoxin family protein [Candidatus Nezhaarchaeales archaeon]
MVVVVKIFGTEPPCAKCRIAEKIAKEVAEEFSGKVKVVKLPVLSEEADKYGVFITPSIVINEKLVFSGRVPSKDELKRAIDKELASLS